MKNNIYKYLILIFLYIFLPIKSYSLEQFNFDITNIEILENGNLFKGRDKGVITSENGIKINADSFEYNKIKNILNANGNVKIEDQIQKIIIFTDSITYLKNLEIILTKNNSKAITEDKKIITADNFKYEKNKNIMNANGSVYLEDKNQDYSISAEEITYFKNEEKIISKGKTSSLVQSKYKINSSDILFLINDQIISSNNDTILKDNNLNLYNLDDFEYLINEEQLKGNNIVAISNYGLPKSDKLYFKNAIINLKDQSFIAKDTKVEIHNDVFGNPDNNPRIKGVSSKKEQNITTIKKGVFTSCNENENCPAWSIKAKEIKHDKNKKQIIYDSATLKIYDIPILYFPKFFHPEPTVKRQSGLLKPQINNSRILGNSLTIPYFYAMSESKDFTFTSSLFDKDIQMLQTEYREVGKNHDLVADFGFTKGYKSSYSNKKKNLNHFFGQYNLNLNLENFLSSKFYLSSERVSNDTYLKIFDANIDNNKVKPENFDVLSNEIKLFLDHKNYDFEAGFQSFENLSAQKSDKYQYVLPYYKFNKKLSQNFVKGSLKLSSSGANELKNTNNLRTKLINDISYRSLDFITNQGIKNNLNINLKNLNSLGKKDSLYKSSPQLELMSNFELVSSLPLLKKNNQNFNYITPKLSLRFNPGDMKDYSTSLEKKININNIFSNNRLGLTDSFESGRSLTLGLDYKKENLQDINKYFEMKIATVLRDKTETNIPKISTINRKGSNLFGSVKNKFSEKFEVDYNFAIDNDLKTFEYNSVQTTFSLNNFITEFNFVEENGEMGDNSFLENSTSITFDENNFLTFNTRRNRKIDLTEYYNLVYEYKNDCLVAGIKYKKTYYEDRDLKPSEDLFFTISIIPITTYEHKLSQ